MIDMYNCATLAMMGMYKLIHYTGHNGMYKSATLATMGMYKPNALATIGMYNLAIHQPS